VNNLSQNTTIKVYTPERQGTGSFDGGKITEIKPIDFPGGTSRAARIGPLFYWAWASANGEGVIGMHPHRGFEIMSYVLEGELGHTDTLTGSRRVGAGGAQVMQTGSGVQHQEEMFGERTEFFQIWFEPNLREALRKKPTYNDYSDQDFPVAEKDGTRVKTVIGEDAPISLVAPVRMYDVTVQGGAIYRRSLAAGNCLAVVAVSGQGKWAADDPANEVAFKEEYFCLFEAAESGMVAVLPDSPGPLRLVMIEVPKRVDYPLYE
jgi:redox-sensitive bicupin YhaK (pirin superfamily)